MIIRLNFRTDIFFSSPTKYRGDELNTAVDISSHLTSKLYDLTSKFTSTTLV